jgi:hypothetical protein
VSRLTRAALALSGALALAIPATSAGAAPSTAEAGQISVNTGSGWSHDPTTPLFDVTRIAPGWTQTVTLAVRNDGGAGASLTIRTADVVDDENGCNHPESFVDTSCNGDDAGELGGEITLAVYTDADDDGSYDATPAWTGSIRALEQPGTLGELAAGAARSYKIQAALPSSSGNETQTDRVGFDMIVALDGADVLVEGTKTTRSSGGIVHRVIDALPLTGTPAERIVAAGLWLLVIGAALTLAATRRGKPQSA